METCTAISRPLSEGFIRVSINKQMKIIFGYDDKFLISLLKLDELLRKKLTESSILKERFNCLEIIFYSFLSYVFISYKS